LIEKLKHYAELVAFSHTIFSTPFIFIAMITASSGVPSLSILILGLLAAVFARNFAMGFNRLVDRKYDELNPRTANRPSVDGRINTNGMMIFVALNGIGFILVSYFINQLAFELSFVFLPILGGYSYFKRFSPSAHIVLGISLGLAPIAGAIAVLGYIPIWSVFLALGVAFWVAGFDVLYSLQDIDFDKQNGLFSIPSRFGENVSLNLALIFHLLTIMLWFLFVKNANLGYFALFAVLASALLLVFEHYLVRKDFTKINRAFFTVNGWLGIIFLILIIADFAL
jgi:4-hydroxybenzoate polyprenyltransferase